MAQVETLTQQAETLPIFGTGIDTQSRIVLPDIKPVRSWGFSKLYPEAGYRALPYSSGAVGHACVKLAIEGEPLYDSRNSLDGDELPTTFGGNILMVPPFQSFATRTVLNRRLALTTTTERRATQHGVTTRTIPTPPLNWDPNLPTDKALIGALQGREIDGVVYDYVTWERPSENGRTVTFNMGDLATQQMFTLEISANA